MLHQRAARSAISGTQVAAVLAGICLATMVVPPLAASMLNSSRISRAESDTRGIAEYLRARAATGPIAIERDIVCGTGRLPKAGPTGAGWLRSPETQAQVFGPERPVDPWGRCYLANLGADPAGISVLVLSAGPNGFIDTAIGAPSPEGDDVGARVW